VAPGFFSRINKSLLWFNIELVWPQYISGRIEKDFRFNRRELTHEVRHVYHSPYTWIYRGADKSLARPGRTQPTAAKDFDFHISYL